ncbi:unnamed protein product [Chironomus riparius]|uniref:Lipase n=1 Tax=Chironomus riparius TaxID=315576 RepID=A0A9N9RJF1_9DIPT|nr:unnamed protein product [Chironomus riparius]
MLRIFVVGILVLSTQGILSPENDDVLDLIRHAGYRGAAYQTATEDNGWIVKIHRIFPRRKMANTMPVFLMHGLFVNSMDYILTGRNKALGYLLADNNFDVFMGNSRGSRHSFVDHKRANYSNLWNFSFNEIGSYDVAAMIDYVLRLTGKPKLFFVGHSQGTTSLIALLSTRPEYNSKIIQAHLFAPVAFMKYLPNPFVKSFIVPLIEVLMERKMKFVNFTDILTAVNPLSKIFCNVAINPITTEFCKSVVFIFAGRNTYYSEIDTSILPDLVDHISYTLSVQQVDHYLQSYRSGKFRKYDYGLNNMRIYGTPEPPEYNISNIIAPIYIYRATEDYLASRRDTEHLIELLPNVKHNRIIPNYNHADFNYGSRSRKVFFYDVLKFIQSESYYRH